MKDPQVILQTFRYSLRAYLTRNRLESEGIPCELVIESSPTDSTGAPTGFRLMVHERDESRARLVLEQIQLEAGPEGGKDVPAELKRILVPIDFTEPSPGLALIAAGFAGNFHAEICFFHAFFVPALDIIPVSENSVYPVTLDEHILFVEKQAREKMEKLVEFVKTHLQGLGIPDINICYSLASGFPEDEILAEAEKYLPNLIIMGTGLNEKGFDIYGSVTARVVDHTKVPVLAIPPNTQLKDLKNIRKIMYATHFESSDFRAIHKLLYLTEPFDTRLHLVHFRTGKKDGKDELMPDEFKESLKQAFILQDVELKILESEDLIQDFEEYVIREEIDLIALTTRKRNFFSRLFHPGVASRLLLHSHKPLLVFH